MRITLAGKQARERGAIVVYFIILVLIAVAVAGVGGYVAQTTYLTHRRSDMIAANQFAIGGAVIACRDLNSAVTNKAGTITGNLTTLATAYSLNSTLSTSARTVYQRTISAPFTNQTVTAQIWLPNSASPTSAKIVTTATTGTVTQSATVNVKMAWGYPGAIISVNAGTSSTANDKGTAQDGNVTINGGSTGALIIDGGQGLAVIANGRVNYDTNYLNPPASSYSMTNYETAGEIPDYTSQGASNSLFNINRLIAVADLTPNGPSSNTNNHFTNMSTFITAAKIYNSTNNAIQGVVVVDVWSTDKSMGNLTDSTLPNGINVKGTLVFNFLGPGWDPTTSKIIINADLNVNAANLSGLVPTNTATYTSGYPPVYTDPTKNPTNIVITSKGFTNYTAGDDLPALVYTIGVVDLHGNVDISGVVYTPSYIELENKSDGQVQYIKGVVIMGNGIYYENTHRSTSIISFDNNTVDSLATMGTAGKQVQVTYWQQ